MNKFDINVYNRIFNFFVCAMRAYIKPTWEGDLSMGDNCKWNG